MIIEKYHASGNDFLVTNHKIYKPEETSKKLCKRHTGIGADGLIIINDYNVAFFNADGSKASLCGNGLRVAGLYLLRHNFINENQINLKVNNKVYPLEIIDKNSYSGRVYFSFNNKLKFEDKKIKVNNHSYYLTFVDVGNKHGVCTVDNFEKISYEDAKKLSKHHRCSGGVNIDFVRVIDDEHLEILTFERGVGFTSSCGSGAMAVAKVLYSKNIIKNIVKVENTLGDLIVNVKDNYIEGGAQYICEVTINEF